MTKKIDPDVIALRMADKALQMTTPRMRRATIDYLFDKFVIHADKLKDGDR